MNKEEILSKSRSENKNGDEREKSLREHAFAKSAAYGGVICMLIVLTERLIFDRSDTTAWIIYTGMLFFNHMTVARQTKIKKDVSFAWMYGLLFIIFTVSYLLGGLL